VRPLQTIAASLERLVPARAPGGFDRAAKFRQLLDDAEDPHGRGINARERAKVDGVLKRANRESIAYDRSTSSTARFLTRAFGFGRGRAARSGSPATRSFSTRSTPVC
jgi:hypothetical protein